MTVRFQGAVSCPRTILLNCPLNALIHPSPPLEPPLEPPLQSVQTKCRQMVNSLELHNNSKFNETSDNNLWHAKRVKSVCLEATKHVVHHFLSEVFRKWSRSRQAYSCLNATSYHYFRAFSQKESPIQLDHVWYKHWHRPCYTYMCVYIYMNVNKCSNVQNLLLPTTNSLLTIKKKVG